MYNISGIIVDAKTKEDAFRAFVENVMKVTNESAVEVQENDISNLLQPCFQAVADRYSGCLSTTKNKLPRFVFENLQIRGNFELVTQDVGNGTFCVKLIREKNGEELVNIIDISENVDDMLVELQHLIARHVALQNIL